MNAAVLACGWVDGGRAGAQAALRAFWLDVARQQSPWRGGCFGGGFGPSPGLAAYNLDDHPFYAWQQQFLRLWSPYQFNPLGANPLRDVLARHVDCARLQASPIPLFITATAVRTGQPRVFERADIDIDALLASACLPQLSRAVQIDGEPYWDGGYSGNPALWPLVYNTASLDLLLVKINPLVRPGPAAGVEQAQHRPWLPGGAACAGACRRRALAGGAPGGRGGAGVAGSAWQLPGAARGVGAPGQPRLTRPEGLAVGAAHPRPARCAQVPRRCCR